MRTWTIGLPPGPGQERFRRACLVHRGHGRPCGNRVAGLRAFSPSARGAGRGGGRGWSKHTPPLPIYTSADGNAPCPCCTRSISTRGSTSARGRRSLHAGWPRPRLGLGQCARRMRRSSSGDLGRQDHPVPASATTSLRGPTTSSWSRPMAIGNTLSRAANLAHGLWPTNSAHGRPGRIGPHPGIRDRPHRGGAAHPSPSCTLTDGGSRRTYRSMSNSPWRRRPWKSIDGRPRSCARTSTSARSPAWTTSIWSPLGRESDGADRRPPP